jgi:hypothetical protein
MHTGVDYTGYMWVTDPVTKVDSKVYLLIFTCMYVRAIHLELVTDTGVLGFSQVVVRFYNLYGIPKILYSDNAKTFISGCNILKKALASMDFFEFVALENSIFNYTTLLCVGWSYLGENDPGRQELPEQHGGALNG